MSKVMDQPHEAIYFVQLARAARLKADQTSNIDLAIRLRETAVRYERKARQLARTG
jgi:hypothetical protein